MRWDQFTEEERRTIAGALTDSGGMRSDYGWYLRCSKLHVELKTWTLKPVPANPPSSGVSDAPGWTPGPWRWVNHDGVAYLRAEANIAKSDTPDFDGLDPIVDDGSAGGEYSQTIDPHTSPYAPLLAAAPDLYTALDDLTDITVCIDGPIGTDPQFFRDLREKTRRALAAIAKARGEKPNAK